MVSVSGAPFQWHIIGTDWVGRQIEFTAPAIFVSEADGYDAPVAQQIRDAYSAITDGVTTSASSRVRPSRSPPSTSRATPT